MHLDMRREVQGEQKLEGIDESKKKVGIVSFPDPVIEFLTKNLGDLQLLLTGL